MLEKYFVAKAVLQIVPHVKQTSLHESAIFSQYYNLNILPHLRCPQRQTLTFSRLTRRVKLSIEMWATFTLPKLAKILFNKQLLVTLHQNKPRYFKKGIAFKHKLSYSNYVGFADQL